MTVIRLNDEDKPLLGNAPAGSTGAATSETSGLRFVNTATPPAEAQVPPPNRGRVKSRDRLKRMSSTVLDVLEDSDEEEGAEAGNAILEEFESFKQMKDEDFGPTRKLTNAAAVLAVIFLLYTALLGRYEFGWSICDSCYFMAQTVTTIGYGDLVPQNQRQRLEITIYMILALTLGATALGIMTQRFISEDASMLENLDSEIAQLVEEDKERESTHVRHRPTGTVIEDDDATAPKPLHFGRRRLIGHELNMKRMWFQAISNTAQLVGIVVFGALMMLWLEKDWSFNTALYWATETVTTVGYGDLVPTRTTTKWFFVFYALTGTYIFGKSVAYIASMPLQNHRFNVEKRVLKQFEKGLSEQMLQAFFEKDEDVGIMCKASKESKTINRAEFVLHALLLLDRIKTSDLLDANDAFNQLDIDFNEQLDKDDVVHFMNLRSAAQHIEAMHGREYLATLSTEELLSHAQVAAPAEAPAS